MDDLCRNTATAEFFSCETNIGVFRDKRQMQLARFTFINEIARCFDSQKVTILLGDPSTGEPPFKLLATRL